MITNDAARHERAADYAERACLALAMAIDAEGGLEWATTLKEMHAELCHTVERLRAYAAVAKAEANRP